MSLLKAENLNIGYDNKTIADNINFEVNEKDYVCILGENGSGKTTLMKTLLGLIKPVKGTIVFGDGIKKNDIGYLPQQTEVQKDFPASVKEIVLSGCQGHCGLRPFYNKDDKKLADKNIEKLGITKLKDKCYRELSGGQQQRVLLARALCAADKLLILDEPVAGLDPDAQKNMYEIIDNLNKKDNMTIVMITHDTDAALSYANKILYFGKEITFSSKEEYLKRKGGENHV